MCSVDFISEAIALEPDLINELLQRDDLRCTDEDQVVDFLKLYLVENEKKVAPHVATRLLETVRFDHVSTEKIIELSMDRSLQKQQTVIKAMCKRLAQASNA